MSLSALFIEIVTLLVCALTTRIAPRVEVNYSGTQVIVARTNDEVLVAVDSEITRPTWWGEEHPNEGFRKLVDIGDHSACGIDGFLGLPNDNDIAGKARAWTNANPHIEADLAIDQLLLGAVQAFSDMKPSTRQQTILRNLRDAKDANYLPKDFHLTEIYCGTYIKNKPSIVLGETYIDEDQTIHFRRKNFAGSEWFSLGGVLSTHSLIEIWSLRDKPLPVDQSYSDSQIREPLLRALKVDSSAEDALDSLVKYVQFATNSPAKTNKIGAKWKSGVRQLINIIFSVDEATFPSRVAPPNNLRVLNKKGRTSVVF